MKKKLLSIGTFVLGLTTFMPNAKADTTILNAEDGYEKVTTLPETLSDYYFVLVDRDQDLMMTLKDGANQVNKTMFYEASVNPTTDLNKVWELEANDDGYSIRCVNYDILLLQTEWNAGYNFRVNDQPKSCEWTKFLFAYDTDSWTIENGKYPSSSTATYKGFIGPWDNVIKDGAEVAGNKADDAIGHFSIYSIKKSDFHKLYMQTNRASLPVIMTPFITNAEFEANGQNSAGWGLGWNGTGTNKPSTFARQTSTNENLSGAFAEMWGTLSANDLNQTIVGLPSGIYKLSVAALSGVDATLYAKNGETELASLTVNGGSPAKIWTLDFEVEEDATDVTIGFSVPASTGIAWVAIDNFSLSYMGADENEVARIDLQAKIDAAKAMDITTNVGTAAFQKPQSAADALAQVISLAEAALNDETTTVTNLQKMGVGIDNAVSLFESAALNAPEEGEMFAIVNISANDVVANNALSPIYDEAKAGDGDYDLKWLHSVNQNYAQAFKFTPVEGEKNQYTISYTAVDGSIHYLSTQALAGYIDGTGVSTRNDRIRATSEAEKALPVIVNLGTEEGVYSITNTLHGQKFGSTGNDDLFTTNNLSTLKIVKVKEASVDLTVTDAEWATLILPFAVEEVPAGLTVYSCEALEEGSETTLALTTVEAIEANTPYIVHGAGEYNFSGYGLATQDTYEVGWLVGTYAEIPATVGTYVLQNQAENGVAFYLVGEDVVPTVGAYRAYLTGETIVAVNALRLILPGNGNATAISEVAAGEDALVDVYSISGVLVRKAVKAGEALNGLQKGIYVVNGAKIAVK